MRVRSFLRKTLAVVTSLGCAAFLMGLAGAPAAAAGETIQLNMNNPPQISGSGWAAGPVAGVPGVAVPGHCDQPLRGCIHVQPEPRRARR